MLKFGRYLKENRERISRVAFVSLKVISVLALILATCVWSLAGLDESKFKFRGKSLLNDDFTTQIFNDYSSSPHVKKVHSVVRMFPNTAMVTYDVRTPALWVYRDGMYIPVDDEGLRIGSITTERPGGIIVLGVESHVPPVYRSWNAHDVDAAVDALRCIRRAGVESAIRAIDVSNVDGKKNSAESEIVLIAISGSRIEFGRPSFSAKAGEATPEQKAAELRTIHTRFPAFKDFETAKIYIPPNPIVTIKNRRYELVK